MSNKNINFNYDSENDILFIYHSGKKSNGSIEYGRDIHISFSKNEVSGLEIMGASNMLSTISKMNITRDALKTLKACDLYTRRAKGLLFVHFDCILEAKAKPLENYLTLQDINYNSPVLATA